MTNITHPAPNFSLVEARALAASHFGVTGSVGNLDSERDQNFRLASEEGDWILKVVNASEPRSESEFQTALLDHLARTGANLAVPTLRKTLDNTTLAFAADSNGAKHALRLVSWLPGKPLAEAERTPETLDSLGRALGRLDRALQGFIHPGALRSFDWDIRRAGASRRRLEHVLDANDRALLERFLDRFDAEVAPRLPALRAQVIQIVVFVAIALCLAQADAINDGRVVQLVTDHGVFGPKQRFEQPAVGIERRAVEDGVFRAEKLRQPRFQRLVQILRATNEAHRAEAEAMRVERFMRCFQHLGVRRQAQVVVGAEVDDLRAIVRTDHTALR